MNTFQLDNHEQHASSTPNIKTLEMNAEESRAGALLTCVIDGDVDRGTCQKRESEREREINDRLTEWDTRNITTSTTNAKKSFAQFKQIKRIANRKIHAHNVCSPCLHIFNINAFNNNINNSRVISEQNFSQTVKWQHSQNSNVSDDGQCV